MSNTLAEHFHPVGLVYIEGKTRDEQPKDNPKILVQDPVSRLWRVIDETTKNGEALGDRLFNTPQQAAEFAKEN